MEVSANGRLREREREEVIKGAFEVDCEELNDAYLTHCV